MKSQITYPGGKDYLITDLTVGAHQDDVEIMAYGPIAACFEAHSFGAIILADGAGSPRTGRFKNFTDEEMKAVRLKEQAKAGKVGHYGLLVQCGFTSSEIKTNPGEIVSEELAELLLTIRPKHLYLHNLFDKHDTHVASALRTIEALRSIADKYRPETITSLEVWRSLDWIADTDKVLLNTAPYPRVASKLLKVHASQIAGGKEYEKAAIGRRFANATFFESHETDNATSLSYGMDLTDFIYSGESYEDLVIRHTEKLKKDILDRITRVGK